MFDERDDELERFFLCYGAMRPTYPVNESPAWEGLARLDGVLTAGMRREAFARGYDRLSLDEQMIAVPDLERECWAAMCAASARLINERVDALAN